MLNKQVFSLEQRERAWIESGLLDLLLGMLMLGFGLGIVTEMIWMGGIFVPAMLPALISAQQSFAARLPSTIQPASGSGRKLTLLGLSIVGLLSIGVGLTFLLAFTADHTSVLSFRSWISDNFTLAMGAFWAVLFLATGWIVRQIRFGLYAGLAAALAAITQILGLSFGAAPLATGCLVMLASSITIISFVKTHPKPNGMS